MFTLPTGTVTFLLTDVVGSARLWEEHPEAMRRALMRHDALAEETVRGNDGVLIKSRGEGDSLFAVFSDPMQAVKAAAALQQALPPETPGQDLRLCVRVALHTGEADQRDGDYYGAAVNRCARLRAIAHGSQILLSRATAERLRERLPHPLHLRDLGQHKLKDLAMPEHVFQLLHPAIPDQFPPLRPRDSALYPSNLPQQLTSFIGREREIDQIHDRLPSTPLLTLTGPGGCGKTRLAIQVAADLLENYPDGVWLAEFATLTNPVRVSHSLSSVLHIREEPDQPILETLTKHLKDKRMLIILDNCEHLIAACANLAEGLLCACPGLRILATSREALGIRGEAILQVPSLTLPSLDPLPPLEQLSQYEAVRLFATRAAATDSPFAITSRNAPSVAQVCHSLDGIPLALELAAAHVNVLSVEQIASRLDNRFRLLTGGSRTALPRQQTLRALIDWSYDLLSGAEQALLRRLSVFAGGWTLDAAEQICSGGVVDEDDVMDLLGRLVDKSLVVADKTDSPNRRYRLLEMVRQYSRERLEERGEDRDVLVRHRSWFLATAEECEAEIRGLDQGAKLNFLEAEHDNFRAALRSCETDADAETHHRLAGALWHFWYVRGYLDEGRERLQRALAHGSEKTTGRAKALCGASCIAWGHGDDGTARALAEQSLAISEELGDMVGVAEALKHLAMVARYRGDYGSGRALFENCLALYRDMGRPRDVAHLLCCLGELAWLQNDLPRARMLQEESLRLSQGIGGNRDRGYSLTNLGNIALTEGRPADAVPLLEEAIRIFRDLGEKWAIAYGLWSLGYAALAQARFADARSLFCEALVRARELDSGWSVGFVLEALGNLAAAQGEPERAIRLLSAAQANREALHYVLPPIMRESHEACLAAMEAQIGSEGYSAAWRIGQALTLTQAAEDALAP